MKLFDKDAPIIAKILASIAIIFGVCMIAGVFVVMFVALLVLPIRDAEHYLQVWENPAVVTAVVTKHGSYDDDGDTDYASFVSYTYDGKVYRNMEYEDRDQEKDLTPLGTEVSLAISPKDPEKQVEQLRKNARSLYAGGIIIPLLLVLVYHFLLRKKLTKRCPGTPDPDTLLHDIKIKIATRFFRTAMLLIAVAMGIFHWCYGLVLGKGVGGIALVCMVLWIPGLLRAIREYRQAEQGDYELSRDTLVEKKEISSADDSSYYLYYQNGDRKWKVSTTFTNYCRAKVGSAVVAVYLTGHAKPIVHYSHEGDAR